MSKTVVILGAGASHGSQFQLPLMADMLNRAVVGGSRYEALKRALNLFAGRMVEVNLEDFLTQLDLTQSIYIDRWGESSDSRFGEVVASARAELEELIADRLGHDGRPSTDHVALFGKLSQTDSIITVNYDSVSDFSLLEVGGRSLRGTPKETSLLERSYNLLRSGMLRAGVPAGLTSLEREGGFFLKLHGSVTWLGCPRRECVSHHEIIEPINEEQAVRPIPGDPCRSCGTLLRRVIVSPTLAKQLSEHPRLELLWHLAHRELMTAARLIIIGISLPQSDSRLTWLLSSSQYMWGTRLHERRLIVVNPDPQAVSRIETACLVKSSETYDSMAQLLDNWKM